MRKFYRDATRLDLTKSYNEEQGKSTKPKLDKDHFITCLQSHIRDLEREKQELKNINALNTATIENNFKIIEVKDAEIVDLKRQLNCLKTICNESDYDAEMKGIQL